MPTPTRSISAGFKLDSYVDVLTDVSAWIRNIAPSQNVTRVQYGTLQPDVASPVTPEISGTQTRGYNLTVLYTAASLAFFKNIENLTDLDYAHGPDGFTTGDLKISGKCNCLTVGVPAASGNSDSVQEFPVELSCSTQVIGTF